MGEEYEKKSERGDEIGKRTVRYEVDGTKTSDKLNAGRKEGQVLIYGDSATRWEQRARWEMK